MVAGWKFASMASCFLIPLAHCGNSGYIPAYLLNVYFREARQYSAFLQDNGLPSETVLSYLAMDGYI